MDLGLKGKVAFVAGSTRGIGLGIARSFLAEGAAVAITGRTPDALNAAKSELVADFPGAKLVAIAADMADEAAVGTALDRTEAELGPVDTAVANVGSGTGPAGYALSRDQWQAGLNLNLTASVLLASAVLPRLVARRAGSLTFISSIVGIEALGGPLPYVAAKAGLQAAAQVYARQVGSDGVRVNVVAPGNVLFQGGSWEKKLAERWAFFEDYIAKEVPLGRFGTPQEIADMVVFLASERAAFVTGAVMVVDGGQTRSF
jgi:3-oxoacyl-[acyl-carrier protein] reductase